MGAETKNSFRIHFGLFLAELICIPAFFFELTRALDGNTLSWAYVFEWPMLAAYAVYMWKKMLREDRGESRRPAPDVDHDDPELAAWNAYLAKVHQNDQGNERDRLAD